MSLFTAKVCRYKHHFHDVGSGYYPLIPLRDVVVFPQMVQALFVSRPKSIAALEQALLRDDRLVVLVAQKNPECEDPQEFRYLSNRHSS